MATQRSTALNRVRSFLLNSRRAIYVQSIIFLIILWSVVANGLGLADTISSPSLVIVETYELFVSLEWISHVTATLGRALVAFLLTVFLATGLGLLLGLSDRWERGFGDHITVSKGAPPLMIIVFAAMWFGTGNVTPIVGASLASFPFLAENLMEGIKDIDQELYDMAESFDVSQRRVIWRVVLQSVFPIWMAGLRYTFAICWKIVTLGEVVASGNGIGFMIETQMRTLAMTPLLAWVLIFMVFVLIIEYGIFQPVERRVLSYRPELNTVTAA